jgi:hypothetical protein
MCSAGRGPACVKIDGVVRYRLADIEAYEQGSTQLKESCSS